MANITINSITNHMSTLDSLELVTFLGAIAERYTYDLLNSIFENRLALENHVLSVFQDWQNPLTDSQVKEFFALNSQL